MSPSSSPEVSSFPSLSSVAADGSSWAAFASLGSPFTSIVSTPVPSVTSSSSRVSISGVAAVSSFSFSTSVTVAAAVPDSFSISTVVSTSMPVSVSDSVFVIVIVSVAESVRDSIFASVSVGVSASGGTFVTVAVTSGVFSFSLTAFAGAGADMGVVAAEGGRAPLLGVAQRFTRFLSGIFLWNESTGTEEGATDTGSCAVLCQSSELKRRRLPSEQSRAQ
mmetsp:Transcript_3874/g.13688  ORF Transcript_3874/g.13688 Transcript_3874/m.13688 type:complete len:221 (-) Transcript_3874:577-1239(-)